MGYESYPQDKSKTDNTNYRDISQLKIVNVRLPRIIQCLSKKGMIKGLGLYNQLKQE